MSEVCKDFNKSNGGNKKVQEVASTKHVNIMTVLQKDLRSKVRT